MNVIGLISIRIPSSHITGFSDNQMFNMALRLNEVCQCYYSYTSIVDTSGAIMHLAFPISLTN